MSGEKQLNDKWNDGALISSIVSFFPELRASHFNIINGGWDSIAVEVDNHIIFKFPRNVAAQKRLMREAQVLKVIRPFLSLPVPAITLHGQPPEFSKHIKIQGNQLLEEEYMKLALPVRDGLANSLAQFYVELHSLDLLLIFKRNGSMVFMISVIQESDQCTRISFILLSSRRNFHSEFLITTSK